MTGNGKEAGSALQGVVTPEIFVRNLTPDNVPPVICIVGEEAYYRDLAHHKLWEVLFGDTPEEDRSLDVFAEKTDLQQLETQLNSDPFFGGGSVVCITDPVLLNPPQRESAKKGTPKRGKKAAPPRREDLPPQERLQQILSDVPDFGTAVIQTDKMDGRRPLTKFLKQNACYVACDPITAKYLPAWLQKEAARYGGRFTPEAVGAILEYVETADKEPPLLILKGEVEKISLFAGERKEWTEADVTALFAGLPEAGNFAMGKAVGAKSGRDLLLLLGDQRKRKVSPVLILAKLTAGLRNLVRVKEAAPLFPGPALAKKIGKSPFVVNMWKRDGAHYTAQQLTRALWELDRLTEDITLGRAGDVEQQYRRLEEILIVLCA